MVFKYCEVKYSPKPSDKKDGFIWRKKNSIKTAIDYLVEQGLIMDDFKNVGDVQTVSVGSCDVSIKIFGEPYEENARIRVCNYKSNRHDLVDAITKMGLRRDKNGIRKV